MASNNDTVQQYIDRLRRDTIEAAQFLTSVQAQEADKRSALEKKKRWSDVLQDVLGTITETNRLGLIYMGTLERTRKHNEKSGRNARLCIDAIKILICEAKKVLDCSEVLKGLIKVLSDRIDDKIPSKGTNSILANLLALKTATDDALVSIKNAINALLVTFHLEEELHGGLAGEKGLLYQLIGMYVLMTDGKKPGLDECASCNPKKTPIFPMDDPACDFYTRTKEQYDETVIQLKQLQREVDLAACKREFAKARKDSLDSAYAAALAAKACDTASKK
ncbi:hypothetical protein SAMN05518672_1035 [Chitinophaga sp. CF118]|uniref:hypothetical protein n=1 Tax=Chitinophaga sp. CF118 TaxID=1884367 RepID=UPI0008F1CB30|nr:hypothetical protein [Chitinophaga sp. CF118]SFD73664.1 hypothetical protein SAMN05518672_1035 [Chitinophaga sp. CF118]